VTGSREVVLTYECPLAGAEHHVPGPDVRIMKIGDGGFVVACDCAAEPLTAADEQPHPTRDHLVNIYADGPSPRQWLVLENAANGWYNTTAWDCPEDYEGTHGQRRANFRERIEEIADANDRSKRGGADETDVAARGVSCPDCGAGAGQKCQRPGGHRVRKSHRARKDAAREQGHLGDGREQGSEQASIEAWA